MKKAWNVNKKKIITYNVNGIRSAVNKGFIDWLQDCGADIVCLQETKAQPEQIPTMEIAGAGYTTYSLSAQKKGYSGVALLCKQEPDHIEKGMGIPAYDNEGRFIRADFGDLSVVSVYHPSGTSGDERQAFKMKWLADFQDYVAELRKTRPFLVLAGDYNICHEAIDIHDPVRNATHSGFLPEERELVQEEASPEVRLAQFIRLWTCKESILKYIGCGLGAETRLHPVLSRKDAVGKLLPHGRYQNQELVFNSMIFNVSHGFMAFDERAAHPGDLIITLCFAGNGSTPFPDIRYILYPGPSKPPTP